jgi:hypothetical protein
VPLVIAYRETKTMACHGPGGEGGPKWFGKNPLARLRL